MEMALRRSKRASNATLRGRDYTLNKSRALIKKSRSCLNDAKIHLEIKADNHIFTMSTAMYELYKVNVLAFYEEQGNEILHEIIQIHDKNNAVVETQIKVFNNKRQNNHSCYTINMYHTTSRVMANGKNASAFRHHHNEIVQKILSCAELDSYDDQINKEIAIQLRQMDITKQEKSLNKETEEIKHTQLSNSYMSPACDNGSHVVIGEHLNICSHCNICVEQGVICDRCDACYHYGCEGLDPQAVVDHTDYHCLSCRQLSLSEDVYADDSQVQSSIGIISSMKASPIILQSTCDDTFVKEVVPPVMARNTTTVPMSLTSTELTPMNNASNQSSRTAYSTHTDCIQLPVDREQTDVKQNIPVKKQKKKSVPRNDDSEQLNLAKSLINSLERKVNDLENTNKILKAGVNACSQGAIQKNEVNACGHGTKENIEEYVQSSGSHREKPYANRDTRIQKDLGYFRNKIQSLEMDSLKQRLSQLESYTTQNRFPPVSAHPLSHYAGFPQPVPGFPHAFPCFPGFPPPVPGFAGFHPTVPGFAGFPPPVPGFAGYPPPVPGFAGFPPQVPGFAGFPPPGTGSAGFPQTVPGLFHQFGFPPNIGMYPRPMYPSQQDNYCNPPQQMTQIPVYEENEENMAQRPSNVSHVQVPDNVNSAIVFLSDSQPQDTLQEDPAQQLPEVKLMENEEVQLVHEELISDKITTPESGMVAQAPPLFTHPASQTIWDSDLTYVVDVVPNEDINSKHNIGETTQLHDSGLQISSLNLGSCNKQADILPDNNTLPTHSPVNSTQPFLGCGRASQLTWRMM